ncbi:serine/threonine-protein kinase CTR1 isoform X2 [Cornus florida]|uniref:serine/threonine-protein kinase CTR1 isoform X2 n=1 Tax=Cornus florida TaxID=4283 RepID=UPI00289848F2|nr:serine/threonine-protein kinase CTR1 isoform X2 [Cornus florida]
MEMPGRRSNNYTLLSQTPDDHHHQHPPKFSALFGGAPSYYESLPGDKNKIKNDRGFDCDLSDNRMIHQPSRIGAGPFPVSIGLQTQSSGSSFGESSLSGDYYVPSLSMAASDADTFGQFRDDVFRIGGGGGGGSSSSKSWAQQTEESYQLQLALALRLSSEATSADDPNFLDPVSDDLALRSSTLSGSAQVMSHRFWVNGCLSYFDKVPDGFYLIHGIDPYVWTVCTDKQENGRIPSIESLKAIDPIINSLIEVILIDQYSDPSLKKLQNRIHSLSYSCITTKEVVDQLAKLVCNRMGGSASTGEGNLVSLWKECSEDLKDCLGSVVLPIGNLSVGLCRHRALLFKVLADTIDLPCRIAKGCKHCTRDDASSCLVRFSLDREYLVDLISKPGCLCKPDSLLNGPSSISISSPLRFPCCRQVEPVIDCRSLTKYHFSDFQALDIVFDESSTGDAGDSIYPKQSDRKCMPSSSNNNESSQLPLPSRVAWPITRDRDPQRFESYSRFMEGGQLNPSKPSKELTLDVGDLDIPWSDLVLKESIGTGSFGRVYRADWNGSDVAVKILMEQEFHADRVKEFLREVAIMKGLRHQNIVLFMGAVTQPPNLSIVTEYLPRGSLYRLLHKPGARKVLDEKRRLCMAYDVAMGMNYLHKRNPAVVHRDLKSPNLLIDKNYTVKVCDFGLSRLKANTFLSSKSAAGTPEWMAPEVLRDEPSDEKSDVYSFGVILWELATLQPPWINLNASQVVAAVGFWGKRLEIPNGLNPQVATIIEACWDNEPRRRPSFSSIMESLKPLIKPSTAQPVRSDMQLLT